MAPRTSLFRKPSSRPSKTDVHISSQRVKASTSPDQVHTRKKSKQKEGGINTKSQEASIGSSQIEFQD